MRGIEKKVADELGIPKDEVHKIVSFSYEYLRSILKNEYTTYEITGLGTMNFIPSAGEKKLKELEAREDFLETRDELIQVINKKLTTCQKKSQENVQ